MRRALAGLSMAAAALALAGCGGDGGDGEATAEVTETPSTSSSASSTAQSTPPTLREVDRHLCETFIVDAGDAYGWLTTLERDGSISGDLATPGYLDVYQLGGTVDALGGDGADSPRLDTAIEAIVREGRALRSAIDSGGAVAPTPLRTALEDAAEVCEDGGVAIAWN
jgi:hypothetical protein